MFRTREVDPSLQRIERDAAILCVGAALVALPVRGWQPDGALGVLGGGALMAISYRAIRGGVDALVRRSPGRTALEQSETPGDAGAPDGAAPPVPDDPWRAAQARRGAAWAMAKFILRYALLAAGAYAILIPLHGHPVGVAVGISAPVVAIAAEAARLVRR